MSELVTIASGLDLLEAYLVRGKLEASGIYCFLANEHLGATGHPIFSSAVGGLGVELRVLRQDLPAAMELLAADEFDEKSELND